MIGAVALRYCTTMSAALNVAMSMGRSKVTVNELRTLPGTGPMSPLMTRGPAAPVTTLRKTVLPVKFSWAATAASRLDRFWLPVQ